MNMFYKYDDVILVENLFQAWDEFKKGKRNKKDIVNFERNLENNLFDLYFQLKSRSYHHGIYYDFYVHDPKRRHIHKASVNDRIVHHLLYSFLYDIFDKKFIHDSYSCRLNKGTHKGVKRLFGFVRKVSRNYTGNCWVLKCDIKKFFANIDQKILFRILGREVDDHELLFLLDKIIESFSSEQGISKGIPLGNLTSQIFANIYLNELDQFIKHTLKVKYYLRYADDFVILASNKMYLENLTPKIEEFLERELSLVLHEKKVVIRNFDHGIDFLGYTILPYYILPRTKTKRRMFKRVNKSNLSSYLGYLSHADSYGLQQDLKNKAMTLLS